MQYAFFFLFQGNNAKYIFERKGGYVFKPFNARHEYEKKTPIVYKPPATKCLLNRPKSIEKLFKSLSMTRKTKPGIWAHTPKQNKANRSQKGNHST